MATHNRLVIRAESADRLREILRTEPLDLNCGGPKRLPNGEWEVEAYAPEAAEQRLRAAGAIVEVDTRMAQRGESRGRFHHDAPAPTHSYTVRPCSANIDRFSEKLSE